MKILLITPVKLHTWLPQHLWRKAIIKLGHKVKVFPLSSRFLKPLTSWRLAQAISAWQPDEVFFSAGKDAVWPIKNTIFFSGVPFSMLSQHEQAIGLQAKLVITNDPVHAQAWLEKGARQAICLPISAADPSLHFPTRPVKKYQADVVFIGGLSPDRQQLFLKLLTAGVSLKLFGTIPEGFLSPQLQPIYFGPVWGKAVSQIYSSCKIALNPLPSHMPTGGNLRTFEIPACGTLQLASRTNPAWFKLDQEIVIYSHFKDLTAKINYYLNHPRQRQKIAQAGYRRTYHEHTYQKHFALLFKTQLAS